MAGLLRISWLDSNCMSSILNFQQIINLWQGNVMYCNKIESFYFLSSSKYKNTFHSESFHSPPHRTSTLPNRDSRDYSSEHPWTIEIKSVVIYTHILIIFTSYKLLFHSYLYESPNIYDYKCNSLHRVVPEYRMG